jgi:hypothetical protein
MVFDIVGIVGMVLMFAALYFIMIRPQIKRRKEAEARGEKYTPSPIFQLGIESNQSYIFIAKVIFVISFIIFLGSGFMVYSYQTQIDQFSQFGSFANVGIRLLREQMGNAVGMLIFSGLVSTAAFWYLKLSKKSVNAPNPNMHIKCPDCAELILKEAKVCKHCSCKLIPQ